ncbi:diguanylate cyclase [Arthrobacter sp. ZGTC131]|uniref:sensor domain-containing diguanylate cyclase n=1 Tax=Arthrobacter sp. ZGTC131 TaxID=2058898 RepID=UPI0011B02EE1|nr:diguanylate cyclase [Arthrobacter sp. ZGTC131]
MDKRQSEPTDGDPSAPVAATARQISAVLNSLPAMIGYWDRELRSRFANDAYVGWIGRTPEQIRGLHMRDVVGEEAFRENQSYLAGVLAGKQQLFGQTIVNASGQTRQAQISYMPDVQDGQVQGFFVMVTDITDRVLAERREHRDASRYRALASSIPSVFVLLFDADLRYIIAEGQELAAFGHAPAELEGRTIHEVLSPELAAELEPRYRAALAGEEVGWTRKIGQRTFSLTARPVDAADGISAGMVVAVDITDRLQRERTWAALHEIATAVARSAAPLDISVRVAAILQRLFAVDSAAVVRFTGSRSADIVAMAPRLPAEVDRVQTFAPGDTSAAATVAFTGKPAIVAYEPGRGPVGEQLFAGGFRAGAAAPIRVHGELWGAIVLTSRARDGVSGSMLDRLAEFAELVEIAIGNTEAWEMLEHKASTDALTGLLNRRAFESRLARELEAADTSGAPLSLVVLDIDSFKKVNDSFGHPAGDEVLIEVASRLRDTSRKGEVLARLGGEEFVWMLPGTGGEDAVQAAERARRSISTAPFPGIGALTISAGVCELADAGKAHLMDRADQALYRAKQYGRNSTVRYRDGT